jgi:hypothetical protein
MKIWKGGNECMGKTNEGQKHVWYGEHGVRDKATGDGRIRLLGMGVSALRIQELVIEE